MKIRVTKRHIKAGHKGSETSCPIALAVREAIKKTCLPKFLRSKSVVVGPDISIGNGMSMQHTAEISAFIDAFDAGKEVKPFIFDLKF